MADNIIFKTGNIDTKVPAIKKGQILFSVNNKNKGEIFFDKDDSTRVSMGGGLLGEYVSNTAVSDLPEGITYIEMPSTPTVTGDPVYGTLMTVKHNVNRAFQLANNNNGDLYYRVLHQNFSSDAGSGYGNWKKLLVNNGEQYNIISKYTKQIYGTLTNPSTLTSYNIPFMDGGNPSGYKNILQNNGLNYRTIEGTTTAEGSAILILGNNVATGTAGNKRARIRLYNSSNTYGELMATGTTQSTSYLPTVTGYLLYKPSGAAVGSSSQPVYIDSTGAATAISSLDLTGSIAGDTITIKDNDEAKPHLNFSRVGWNYITSPTGSTIAFVPTGTSNSNSARLAINGTAVFPGANTGVVNLGTSDYKWNNVYANSFSGNAATATKLATAVGLTVGSTRKNFDGSSSISWTWDEIGLLHSWSSTITCATWSRLCHVTYRNATTGSKFLLNVAGTRGSVVYNDLYVINATHAGPGNKGTIVKLSGNKYSSGYQIRVLVDSSGNCYVEFYDAVNSATNSTTQIVYCYLFPIYADTITKYTTFTSGESIPSGYSIEQTLTVTSSADLQGRLVGLADRATADANGDVFTSTYLKLSGGIVSNSIGENNHNGILQIKNNTSGSIGFHSPLRVMSPNAVGTQLIMIGPANSSKNAGYLGFYNSGISSSDSNFLTLGLYALDNAINVFGSGSVALWYTDYTNTYNRPLFVYGKHSSTGCTAEFRSKNQNGSYIYFSGDSITATTPNNMIASVGYYEGLACIANEKTYARIGVTDAGKPNFWNSSNPDASGKFELIVGNGYINVGPIKLDNGNGYNTCPNNYISAGRGYSTGSGLYGLKLVATEQHDAISGVGQDLTGKAYELSLGAALNTNGVGYITFDGHTYAAPTTWREAGGFHFLADETAKFYVNGRISVGYDVEANNSINCAGWFRSGGNTGWLNQTHGGGWYMEDSTYVRSYSNKSIVVGNTIYVGTTSGGGTGLSLYGTTSADVYGIHFSQTGNYGKHGDVQSDWATYFTMNGVGQRGWVYRAGSTNVASISANGVGAFKGIMGETGHVLSPDGGRYTCATSTVTGYLKITLPVSWTNCMLRLIVDIYDYSNGGTVTYVLGGYNYSPTPAWYSLSAHCIAPWGQAKSNLTVRFGHDGSKCAIYIGESNTSWNYPQVIIRDVLIGYYSASDIATYSKGWGIDFTTTLGSYISTISNTNTGYSVNYAASAGYANTASKDANGNTITSSYLRRYEWWNSNNGNNVDNLRAGTTFAYASHNAPTAGTIVTFDCSTNESYSLQIMGDYNNTVNHLHFRNRNGDNDTWGDWRTILDNNNYTDYTVSKTGSGASGTWGINVTGTAAAFSSNRTISLSGAVTGSVASNGASGWSIATTIAGKVITPTNFTTAFRTQTKGDANAGTYFSVIRSNTADSWGYMPQWSSGIAFGQSDTHGYLYVHYSGVAAYLGGGSADKLNWVRQIAFTDGTGASGTWGISITGSAGSCTGNAATATALTSSAGSSTSPIYFSGGKPVQCGRQPSTNIAVEYGSTLPTSGNYAGRMFFLV